RLGGRHRAGARHAHGLLLLAAPADDEGHHNRGMSRLRPALASPEAQGAYVRRLFHTIADRYDLITRLLSYGQDARWKRRLVALADLSGAGPSTRTLDLACGTGDIAFALAARGADVVGLDLTLRMLRLAHAKIPPAPAAVFLARDMLAPPLADR